MAEQKKRTLDPFYLAHFTILEKLDDRSNRYKVACKYCLKDDLIHRETRLLEHIINSKACKEAPTAVRMEGLRMLKGKRSSTEDNANQPNQPKKLKSTPLESFLVREIDKATSDEFDRKLLQYVEQLIYIMPF